MSDQNCFYLSPTGFTGGFHPSVRLYVPLQFSTVVFFMRLRNYMKFAEQLQNVKLQIKFTLL